MRVSVIIATKNEEDNIENCLSSLEKQTYKNLEIIVVDNNSIDKTVEIAKKYTKLVYNLKNSKDIYKIKNFRGAQINFGFDKSNGDIIFFPDADMTFNKNLIKEVVKKSVNIDAFFVPEIVIGSGFLGKIRKFERSFYNMTCIDAIRFVKKDVFYTSNGFDIKNIKFGPDDWDFTKTLKKHGFKLGITNNSLYHNEECMTWENYLLKKGEYVDAFKSYIEKWGKDDSDIKKQFGFLYRYLGIFTENKKWLKLLRFPLLTIGLYWLKFLVGVFFLIKKVRN